MDEVLIDVFYVLDNKMKALTAKGLGIVRLCTPISNYMEVKMWLESNPEQLCTTVLHLIGINFALCGGTKHKKSCHPGFNPQITVTLDLDGFKCLQFQEDAQGKTHQGGVAKQPILPKVVNAYPNYFDPTRCVVRLYNKYVSLLPVTHKNKSLYMHAHKHTTPKVWYLDYPWGINKICLIVNNMVKVIGMTNGNFRNQSLRATITTRTFNAGQEEQMVQSVTGHTLSIVHRYKNATDSMKCKASSIIQGAKKCVQLSKQCVARKGCIGKKLAPKLKKKSVNVPFKNGNLGASAQDNSDDDFIPLSQNIHTFKGQSLSQSSHKKEHSDDTKCACELISAMAPKKYKKICINVEFVNNSD